MDKPTLLIQRLNEIGASLEKSGQALALIGLGSVGNERERLDKYSDLDFFVIAKAGHKGGLLSDLSWLSAVHPLGYQFQNTVDGFKALFDDGIYCEFAVFELSELASIPFAEGRVVWNEPGFDPTDSHPQKALPVQTQPSIEWLLGEALTCLYVGLCRYQRGEKLSAFRFIQVFAVDRILQLAAFLEKENPALRDPFSLERRFEQRFPETAQALAALMQGYNASPQAALAVLDFLESHFEVNSRIGAAIRELSLTK